MLSFHAPFSSLFFFPFFAVKSLSFLSIQWFILFTSSTQNVTKTDILSTFSLIVSKIFILNYFMITRDCLQEITLFIHILLPN